MAYGGSDVLQTISGLIHGAHSTLVRVEYIRSFSHTEKGLIAMGQCRENGTGSG